MTDPATPAAEPPKPPRKTRANAAYLLLLLAALQATRTSYAHRHRLIVSDAFAFEAEHGQAAAAYVRIVNRSAAAATVDSVTSDVSPAVSFHSSRQVNGLVVMEELAHPTIGSGDSLVLAPGGTHLMLEGVSRALKAGDSLTVTFWFHAEGRRDVTAAVRPYGS